MFIEMITSSPATLDNGSYEIHGGLYVGKANTIKIFARDLLFRWGRFRSPFLDLEIMFGPDRLTVILNPEAWRILIIFTAFLAASCGGLEIILEVRTTA